MLKTISISNNTPRDIKQLKLTLNLKKGLGGYYFFGYFFMFAFFLPALSYLIISREFSFPLIFQLIICNLISVFVGFIIFKNVDKRYLKRLNAFVYGQICNAKVISHERRFVFWKSTRDYSVTVELINTNGEIQHEIIQSSNSYLHKQLPVGSEINGLIDLKTKFVFFPIELGVCSFFEKKEI